MFKYQEKINLGTKLRAFIAKPIQYEVRVSSGNWSEYFGKYNNQKWGIWDSNSCWCLSSVNSLEDQLEWLWKNGQFNAESQKFFADNHFIDSDGDFSISERYLEILGGHKDEGSSTEEAWRLMQKYGCIPRDMLTYTNEKAHRYSDKSVFNDDYFNPLEVTEKMRALGQEFLKHVYVAYERIGKPWQTPNHLIIRNILKMSPLCIGVPVPRATYLWNQTEVKWDGYKGADHAIELYAMDEEGGYLIFDQYEPHLKRLAPGYYIPLITQGMVYARNPAVITTPVITEEISFWTSIINWFNNIFNPIPIGRTQ